LRGVFFSFFNLQSKEIKEAKKKTDLIKFELQACQKNPFFSKNLQTHYQNKKSRIGEELYVSTDSSNEPSLAVRIQKLNDDKKQ
jgi:hypothetical protein